MILSPHLNAYPRPWRRLGGVLLSTVYQCGRKGLGIRLRLVVRLFFARHQMGFVGAERVSLPTLVETWKQWHRQEMAIAVASFQIEKVDHE